MLNVEWLNDANADDLRRAEWLLTAREEQNPPDGDWSVWLLLAGRGFGKTRTAAEDMAWYGLEHPGSRLAVVAETFSDGRDVCMEGESGILSCFVDDYREGWNRSIGELVLPNGTIFRLFSGDKPDGLRGYQFDRAWTDELAKYRYADETWTQLQLGLRLGDNPQNIVTTTPRAIPLIRLLVEQEGVVITTGSTFDNAANLPKKFLDNVSALYEGTKIGEQELHGRILSLDDDAIFDREWWLNQNRWNEQDRWSNPDNQVVARWISWDMALKDKDSSAYNAMTVFELTADYHLDVRYAWRDKLSFPKLIPIISDTAYQWNYDGKLYGVVVEDKAHGITALQTIEESTDKWLKDTMIPFPVHQSKEVRWNQAAAWARNGCVRLPEPSAEHQWLHAYEEELYSLPNAAYKDWSDTFAQGVVYLEPTISQGFWARRNQGVA